MTAPRGPVRAFSRALLARVELLALSAPPLRAAAEVAAVAAASSLVARLVVPLGAPEWVLRQAVMLFVAPAAALWGAFRLRVERLPRALAEAAVVLVPIVAIDVARDTLYRPPTRNPFFLLLTCLAFAVLRSLALAAHVLARRARTRLADRLLLGQLLALGLLVGAVALVPATVATLRVASKFVPPGATLRESLALRFVAGVLPQLAIVGFWVVAALVVLLPAFALLSRAVTKPVTRRLEALTAHVETLGEGRLDARLDDVSGDEVGRLAGEVNAMAARLGRANEALTHEKGRTEALLASRRELLASISHELRTPVAALGARIETLPAGPEREALLEDAARLGRTLEDLFDLARLEAGRLAVESVPFDGGAVVARVAASFAPLAHRTQRMEIVVDRPDAPLLLLGDPHRLAQVVGNLVHNAIRHGLSGGLVSVALSPESAEWARVVVADTGPGLAASEAAELFERFRRGRGAGEGGAGLGLALVKELTEAMGGSVSLASRPGQGTEVVVRLRRA